MENVYLYGCGSGPDCYISCEQGESYCGKYGFSGYAEGFKIVASGKNSGDYIKHGDKVGLRSNGASNLWFSCGCNDYCWMASCPGKISKIFLKFVKIKQWFGCLYFLPRLY